MELKKSDKMILIIGVIILILSAIGIALYTSPPGEEKIGEIQIEKTFSPTWLKEEKEINLGESLFVERSKPFEDTYTITVEEGEAAVLTSVNISLSWEDDVTYGIFFKKGLDTLTATITCAGREKKNISKGSGDIWFNFSINSVPSEEVVTAYNDSDARNKLREEYKGKDSASVDVTISIETGERRIRLLKYLKDKGNDFTLKARYTYYVLSEVVEEVEGSEETGGSSSGGESIVETGHGIGEFYRNLGYGRGMI